MRHFDDERDVADYVMDQAEHRVKWTITSIFEGCLFRIFFFFLFCAVIGALIYKVTVGDKAEEFQKPADLLRDAIPKDQKDKTAKVTEWDGKSAFSCGGSEVVELRAKAPVELAKGPAIKVGGSCLLTIVDVSVKAPVALEVGGNAKATLQGKTALEGSEFAVKIMGNGVVESQGAKITGEKKISANGAFNEK